MVPEEYGRCTSRDPSDVSPIMLGKVNTNAGVSQTRDDVRDSAMAHLAIPEIRDFLGVLGVDNGGGVNGREHQYWSADLCACLLLSAMNAKMGHEDSLMLGRLRNNMLVRCDVRPATFDKSLKELMNLLQTLKSRGQGDDIFSHD